MSETKKKRRCVCGYHQIQSHNALAIKRLLSNRKRRECTRRERESDVMAVAIETDRLALALVSGAAVATVEADGLSMLLMLNAMQCSGRWHKQTCHKSSDEASKQLWLALAFGRRY